MIGVAEEEDTGRLQADKGGSEFVWVGETIREGKSPTKRESH